MSSSLPNELSTDITREKSPLDIFFKKSSFNEYFNIDLGEIYISFLIFNLVKIFDYQEVNIENKDFEISKKKEETPRQLDLFSELGEDLSSQKLNIENTDKVYQYIDSPKAQRVLVENLLSRKAVCFDTETTSLEETEAELIGLSFSYKKGLAYYIPISENQEEAKKTLEILLERWNRYD